jgi:hypothetical protein
MYIYSADRRQAVNLVSAPTHVPNCTPDNFYETHIIRRSSFPMGTNTHSKNPLKRENSTHFCLLLEAMTLTRNLFSSFRLVRFNQKRTSWLSSRLSGVWLTHYTLMSASSPFLGSTTSPLMQTQLWILNASPIRDGFECVPKSVDWQGGSRKPGVGLASSRP